LRMGSCLFLQLKECKTNTLLLSVQVFKHINVLRYLMDSS
jgi:hypothetical protein